ncbi:MAG: patatin-like phospholipase family protein [Nitriliruptoraceae bacterium]|nr:patatin-like phospholipase family protein [Nitriliruptoraceae bacterium]
MTASDKRCDLVLGGGGVRGVAHIGALTALEERGYQAVRAAGASAGAIAGAFAIAGVDGATLRELFEALDLRGFITADVLERLRSRRGVGRLVERFGTEAVDPLAWIEEILDEHGVRTFGDLRVPDADHTAPPERRYRLVVRCLDVLQRRVVRLPWDYERYDLDPDAQPVAQAVRASMSIPFVYDPVRIGNRDTGRQGLLIDGGLATGFPVTVLDRRDGQPPRWPTFGVRLLSRPRGDQDVPDGGLALARMIVDAMLDANDLLEPTTTCDERRTVRVDLSGVNAFDLDVGEEHDLFADGYAAMASFLEDFDFADYVETCRPSP